MLVKRIDKNSIPVGLYEAGEDIVKGRAVCLKNGKVMLPSSAEDVANLLGFATYRIEDVAGGDIADHDLIPAGKKVVVYTLAKDNMWGTTEFVGDLVAGDKLTVNFSTNKGKLVKVTTEEPLFEVFEVGHAGSYPMIDIIVL